MSEQSKKSVIVVFEYTSGSYCGGRFMVYYAPEEIERVKAEENAPNSNTKIIAIGVSGDEGRKLCDDALLHSGVICHRIKTLQADPDVPPERVGLEALNLLLAGQLAIVDKSK